MAEVLNFQLYRVYICAYSVAPFTLVIILSWMVVYILLYIETPSQPVFEVGRYAVPLF